MAVSTKNPAEFTDFSGGITDNQFSGEANSGVVVDNFNITPDRKLLSRSGSVLDDVSHSPIPLGNSRVGLLINYSRSEKFFLQSGRDIFYRPNDDQSGAWVKLQGPSGNSALSAGSVSSHVSTAEWNRQRFVVGDAFSAPMKFYRDSSGAFQLRNVGLPMLLSSPKVSTVTTSGTHSYIYGFVYSYIYTVGAQTFQELGPVTWVDIANSDDPTTTPNVITNIPVLSNAAGDNYDTANVKVFIYRTTNNRTNLYKVGEIVNGTTMYSDAMSDDQAQTKSQLYTNDQTLDYNPAPKAKFLHVTGNIGLYGYTFDADGPHANRVHQSTPGNPGFVPAITWVEVGDEVKGINSVKNVPVVLCRKIIYRIEGFFTSSGSGGMNPVKIHHTAGCISHQSCVEAENYLFWAGLDGFYATDGYQVIKISDHLNTRYKQMLRAMKDQMRIIGRFDETNRRVLWTLQLNSSNLENDTIFCLDLRYGVSPRSSFTTWSGPSFRPTAVEVFGGAVYRGDNSGFLFRHDDGVLTDPKVDTAKDPSLWAKETVLWNFTTNQINFGGSFFRKFVSRVLVQAGNIGNTTIAITAINDQGKRTRELKNIRWRRNFAWGDDTFTWGSSDCVWNAEGLVEQWRRFPARGLRLSYLQLKFSNGLGIITNSDSDGRLTLNRNLKMAVLPNKWPKASVDYFLKLSNDNYERTFQVTALNSSGDTVVLSDPLNKLPATGSYEWEMVGYAKGEPLNLLGFNLHWDNVDQNQGTFARGDDGGNRGAS